MFSVEQFRVNALYKLALRPVVQTVQAIFIAAPASWLHVPAAPVLKATELATADELEHFKANPREPLPPHLEAALYQRTAAGTRRLLFAWLVWVGTINLCSAHFDTLMLPPETLYAMLPYRVFAALGCYTAAILVLRSGSSRVDGLLFIAACTNLVFFAGLMTWATGNDNYLWTSVFAVATGVIMMRVKFGYSVALALITVVLSSILAAFSGAGHAAALAQEIVIYALALMALLVARHMKIGLNQRLFIATLYNEVQVEKLAEANRLLQEISNRDGLTGVANRRGFDDEVAMWETAPSRRSKFVSILMIDVDHFKALNDCLGHQEGDARLRDVATAIRAAVRSDDLVARYGGEEFVAMIESDTEAEARDAAERIRVRIEQLRFANPGAPHGVVTVSIGVASLESRIADIDLLVRRADSCLYIAKGAGRNCVRVHAMNVATEAGSFDKVAA